VHGQEEEELKNVTFVLRTFPAVKEPLTIQQMKAFSENPANKPKLDSKSTGKISQPSTKICHISIG
jgi:hypothetical protein